MTDDKVRRTAVLNIFGKDITVKNYICAKNGGPYKEKPDPKRMQLSICPTFFCGAHCRFCSAAGTTDRKGFLDTKKLEIVLKELYQKDLIRGISITGGEPFTDAGLLNEIIEMIFDITGVETEVSINTNGSGLGKLSRIRRLAYVDAIHISRHHYDDEKNRAYFGVHVATGEEIKEITGIVQDPRLFVFNCLLLKDGIGTKDEMYKFLEFAGETGVPKVGFITPALVNEYTRENKVSYTSLFDRADEKMLLTTSFEDFDICRCCDGIYYTAGGKLVEFYGRETMYVCPAYSRGLVFGADNRLKSGFAPGSEILFE